MCASLAAAYSLQTLFHSSFCACAPARTDTPSGLMSLELCVSGLSWLGAPATCSIRRAGGPAPEAQRSLKTPPQDRPRPALSRRQVFRRRSLSAHLHVRPRRPPPRFWAPDQALRVRAGPRSLSLPPGANRQRPIFRTPRLLRRTPPRARGQGPPPRDRPTARASTPLVPAAPCPPRPVRRDELRDAEPGRTGRGDRGGSPKRSALRDRPGR